MAVLSKVTGVDLGLRGQIAVARRCGCRNRARLNRSRKIAVPKFNDELKNCPMGGGVWSVVTIRSEWRGEDIAHAGLSKGVAFNDRKLIIFRCTSSYSPSRSKLKLVRMVIGLIA